eukprot:287204_1
MGICHSNGLDGDGSQDSKNRQIAKAIEDQRRLEAQCSKLLLLGAGESGKSTLFKQMISLYGTGFSQDDLMGFTNTVYNNSLAAMKTMIEENARMQSSDPQFSLSADAEVAKVAVLPTAVDSEVDEELAEHINTLWKDPGIQATFDLRAQFQIRC